MRRIAPALIATALFALCGCPAGSGIPGIPDKPDVPSRDNVPGSEYVGDDRDRGVNPNACGGYARTDLGKKIKMFLQSTLALHEAVIDTESYVVDTCRQMGAELSMADLSGSTREVCNAVAAELRNHLQVSMKAGARAQVDYQPARCEVNADVAARAAAQCEGKATADVHAQCSGTCDGTCAGRCDGTCRGGNRGGECNGACDGTCRGTCRGSCTGGADVDGSAACRAHASVEANLEARCEPAEVTVDYEAELVIDTSKLERATRAIKVGLPRLIMVHAKLTGPVAVASQAWAQSARELGKASRGFLRDVGDEIVCVSGQLAAALNMLTEIQGSIDVSVSVSVEVSGSAGASI